MRQLGATGSIGVGVLFIVSTDEAAKSMSFILRGLAGAACIVLLPGLGLLGFVAVKI